MTYRLVFELVIFLLPFAAFGIYRLAVAEAVEEGRKPWPITVLFLIGAVFAIVAWVALILIDRGGEDTCIQRARMVDGKIIRDQTVPCVKEKSDLGLPASRDPGGRASGLGHADPAGPGMEPGPLDAEDQQEPDMPPGPQDTEELDSTDEVEDLIQELEDPQ